jgi:hypothetical protein
VPAVEELFHRGTVTQVCRACRAESASPVLVHRFQNVEAAREVERDRVLDDRDVLGILEYPACAGGVDRGGQQLLGEAPQSLGLLAVDPNEIRELPYLSRGPQLGFPRIAGCTRAAGRPEASALGIDAG